MHPFSGTGLGRRTTTLALALTVLASIGLVGTAAAGVLPLSGFTAHSPVAPASAAHAPVAAAPHPLAIPSSTLPSVTWTSTFQLYMLQGFPVSWTVAPPPAANLTSYTNVSVSLQIAVITSNCIIVFGLPCPIAANVTDQLGTPPSFVAFSSVTSWAWTVNATKALINSQIPTGTFLPGEYRLTAWAIFQNGKNATSTHATLTAAISQDVFIAFTAVSGTFLSPAAGQGLTVGNVTVTVQYSGDFITGANVSVFSGTNLTYSQGVFVPGGGQQAFSFVWPAAAKGTYSLKLTITDSVNPGTPTVVTSSATLASGTGGGVSTIYINQTVYNNTTGASGAQVFSGIGPGPTAAVLLVVGLIIGMIVALALGRALWGGAAPSPAQPWAPKAGAFECSVCHQSFPTQAELEEHSKSAHGMM